MCQLALSHWGERAEVTNVEVHDTIRTVQLFGESWLSNSLYNGKSASPLSVGPTNRAFQFYDVRLSNCLSSSFLSH
jgi:hypothetical protein